MTDTTDPQAVRIPYCHKIRYGITGAPILTEDEMEGSHAPGVGVDPALIELIYSAARDGKPASVGASVTGWWTRYGVREQSERQVTTHFKDGPDGWPAWLAEEARLHDPDATPVPSAPADRAALRDRIAAALLARIKWATVSEDRPADALTSLLAATEFDLADAVLAVLPEPADRAAIRSAALREAVAELKRDALGAIPRLLRMADEAQQSEAEAPCCSDPTCRCNQVNAAGRCDCAKWDNAPADEAQQSETQDTDGPPAPLRRSWDDCPGFPEQCPNIRPVDPNPPTHFGGIRCGCADQPAVGAQQPKED